MKKLAITTGDPAGIGPEIALKALLRLKIDKTLEDLTPLLITDRTVIEETVRLLNPEDMKIEFISPEKAYRADFTFQPSTLYCIDTGVLEDFKKGEATPEGGRASYEYIKLAVELAMQKVVHAIVTAPISKTSLRLAGYEWPGQTEMLKDLTGVNEVSMLFYAPFEPQDLMVILTTIHVPLREVPQLITEERVLRTIGHARKGAESFGIEKPRIGVAGLNPHASEGGLFGEEEQKAIIPAIQKASEMGLDIYGPVPPDIIFYKAVHGEYDIVISMYHDQGLAPLKLIAFEKAVNITVGLPIIRTSPDHGTAYDIAWKGMANPSSMIEAIKTGLRLKPAG